MRIAALALSSVLLSGCSWLGFGGNASQSHNQSYNSGRYQGPGYAGNAGYAGNRGVNSYAAAQRGPCEITSVNAPIPQGCRPEQITIALPNSGNNYAHNNYNSGGYNAHGQTPSANSYGQAAYGQGANRDQYEANIDHKYWRRPQFRVTGSLDVRRSLNGTAFNGGDLPNGFDPIADSSVFTREGSEASGTITETLYAPYDVGSDFFRIGTAPDLSEVVAQDASIEFGELYAAPLSASLGVEYGISDRFSVFGNASLTTAQGDSLSSSTYEGDVYRHTYDEFFAQEFTETTTFTPTLDATGSPTFNPDGSPAGTTTTEQTPTLVGGLPVFSPTGDFAFNSTRIVDQVYAQTDISVSDMERGALEVGGRYYFKDAFANYLERPLTPYISGSIGGAHYEDVTVTQETKALIIDGLFESGETEFDNLGAGAAHSQTILDEGWVATGAIAVGAEWQITPRAALAFETGLHFEGGRDLTAGGTTDNNVSVPLTLRGSIGF